MTFGRREKLRLEVWKEKDIYGLILSRSEQTTHFQPNLYGHVAHKGEKENMVRVGVRPPFPSISYTLISMLKGPSSSVPYCTSARLHQRHHPADCSADQGSTSFLKKKRNNSGGNSYCCKKKIRDRGEKLLHI